MQDKTTPQYHPAGQKSQHMWKIQVTTYRVLNSTDEIESVGFNWLFIYTNGEIGHVTLCHLTSSHQLCLLLKEVDSPLVAYMWIWTFDFISFLLSYVLEFFSLFTSFFFHLSSLYIINVLCFCFLLFGFVCVSLLYFVTCALCIDYDLFLISFVFGSTSPLFGSSFSFVFGDIFVLGIFHIKCLTNLYTSETKRMHLSYTVPIYLWKLFSIILYYYTILLNIIQILFMILIFNWLYVLSVYRVNWGRGLKKRRWRCQKAVTICIIIMYML